MVLLKNNLFPKILADLWFWRVLTTADISKVHFKDAENDYGYKTLLKIAKEGYIGQVNLGGDYKEFGWILADKGHKYLNRTQTLDEMRDSGFQSEHIEHDFYCTAFQRGPWIANVPKGYELFSEQELRRRHPEHFPHWVPQTELHRPDGYSRISIKGELKTIAFEVELNQKSSSFYKVLGRFYEYQDSVFRILWLVKSLSMAKSIQRFLKESSSENYLAHDFALLEDFKKLGWLCPIVLGREQGETLSYILEYDVSPKALPGDYLIGLNTSKRPYKSKSWKNRIEAANVN